MSDSAGTGDLYFQDFGDPSHPPLVIIHGLYGDSSTMVPLAQRFADRFRVIAIDALGHGRSPRPTGFTLEHSGRAVVDLIRSLGYESAVVLGISMGSYVAAQAAIVEPSRVSRLILVVSKAHGLTSSVAAFAAREGFDLAAATMDETLAFMAGAMWSPQTPQETRDAITAAQADDAWQATADERAAIERSLAGFDLRPALPSITAPTLVVSGLSDGLNPPEAGEEVARLIAGARFVVYENSGHMLASEETDRLVADVTRLVLG
jgi:pimeloyl-ACP methyl ester carboxylesterase